MVKNAFSSDIVRSRRHTSSKNLLTKKLLVSRDVVFNEVEAWSWSNEETVKENPVVNEPDEPLHEVPPPATLPSPQHATSSPVRGSPSSGEGSSSESSV